MRSEEHSSLTEQLECFCICKCVPSGGDGHECMAYSVPIAVGTMGLGYIAGGLWQRGRGRPYTWTSPAPHLELQKQLYDQGW